MDILDHLEQVIAQRRTASPETSYVAKLTAGGLPLIARKLGEEGVEAAVALLTGDDAELVGEAADIVFHLMVALQARGLSLADVKAELARREGVSGIAEKAGRTEVRVIEFLGSGAEKHYEVTSMKAEKSPTRAQKLSARESGRAFADAKKSKGKEEDNA